jgi:hypothetical protein
MSPLSIPFRRAATLLGARLATLEERLESGDEGAWSLYLVTLEAALKLDQQLTPGAHGELLSTKQMAERLGVTPKSLIRRKSKGQAGPASQVGRIIR